MNSSLLKTSEVLFVDFHKDLKIKLMPDQMGSLLFTVWCYSPASSNLLPVLLLIRKRVIEMFVHDGQIAGHHRAGAALDEAEHFLLIRGVQVVKEDSSYTAGLSSVADVEVPVTPGQHAVTYTETEAGPNKYPNIWHDIRQMKSERQICLYVDISIYNDRVMKI